MTVRVTVTALAASKKLPIEALYACGIESRQDRGVLIPYFDESGQKIAEKRRTALSAKDGSYWPRGQALLAYGLWRLHDIQKRGRLILVEGESDCWVLWHYGYPALGIPGSGAVKTLTAEALVGVDRIDVVIEPDQGGETFRDGIGRRLLELGYNGFVYQIEMPVTAKDPAAMHVEDPTTFRDRFDELRCRNAPLALPPLNRPSPAPSSPAPSMSAPRSHEQPRPRGGDDHRSDDHLPPRSAMESVGMRVFANVDSPDSLGVCLWDVRASKVEWLWPGRLPLGKLAILDGDPGLGKSSLTLDLAARVSRGQPMPGETDARPAANVVLLSAEDGLSDTIRPRLENAGADLTRVFALDAVPNGAGQPGRPPVFPDDAGWLHDMIRMQNARLVVIDPLMAFLGMNVNAMNDQNVRRALFPLSRLAEATGATILVVRHLNKNPQGAAVYRGGGSIGIIGAARIGLLVAQDPDDPQGRVLAVSKSNLAAKAATMRFRVVTEDDGPRLQWAGEAAFSADELLKPEPSAEAPVIADAIEFLQAMLNGGPVRVPELFDEAHRLGLSDITLRRAKANLGAIAYTMPTETGKEWYWALKRAA